MGKFFVSSFIGLILMCFGPFQLWAAQYSFVYDKKIEIPPFGPADAGIIYIEGIAGNVTSITLKLFGYSHRFTYETMIAISNPYGDTTLIWSGITCNIPYDAPIDLVFTDASQEEFGRKNCSSGTYTPGLEWAQRSFTIPFAPTPPFNSSLNKLVEAEDLNGRWILWAEDFTQGDGGYIERFELVFETSPEA